MSDSDESDIDDAVAWLLVSGTVSGLGEEEMWDGAERLSGSSEACNHARARCQSSVSL